MNAPSHKQSISLTSGTRGGKASKSITRPERQRMEDFSGLALPPLFGGNILEAELESGTGGVELDTEDEVDLGPGSSELLEGVSQEVEERRALEKRKYLVLNKRCKEIEQVNQRILSRLHQVQKLTRRFKKERRFLMKTLDARGDDYRNAQLTILLEDEHYSHLDSATGAEDERINGVANSSPSLALQNTSGPKKKRHRVPKQEKDKDPQAESDMSMLADMQFGEFPTPASLSH